MWLIQSIKVGQQGKIALCIKPDKIPHLKFYSCQFIIKISVTAAYVVMGWCGEAKSFAILIFPVSFIFSMAFSEEAVSKNTLMGVLGISPLFKHWTKQVFFSRKEILNWIEAPGKGYFWITEGFLCQRRKTYFNNQLCSLMYSCSFRKMQILT